MYIDTHAHIYHANFKDKAAMVGRAIEAGVDKIYMPNIDLDSIDPMHELADQYPDHCYPMMGLHPCHVFADYKEVLSEMRAHFEQRKYAAVGEIGIDLYWDKTFEQEQIEAYKTQIEWSRELDLPFVIHSREALDLTIGIVEELQDGNLKGIFHCFNGTVEQGKRIVDLGFYMGLGGVITYKKAGVDQSVKELPIEHMVLETDAPFLTPVRYRKKGVNNEPAFMVSVAERLSRIYDIDLDEVERITTQNAKKVFQ